MERKFKQNFFEKFGDFYSKLGRRALFCLGCIALGALMQILLPIQYIGGMFIVFSIYNLLSICKTEKTKYLKTICVTLPNGKVTSCTLFEHRIYAHAPSILALFSLGFYVPYKKEYILVRNMEIKNLAQGTRVPSAFLAMGLLNIEVLPKSKYAAIITTPQIIAEELYAQIAPRREAFIREIKPFIKTGLLTELYYTDKLSLCKDVVTNGDIIFHYESHSGAQCGLYIKKEYVEKIKEDDSILLAAYIQVDNPNVLIFTTEVLERLLIQRKTSNNGSTNAVETSEIIAEDHKIADTEAVVEPDVIEVINKNKKVFTRGTIASRLRGRYCTWRLVLGIIMLVVSLDGFALTIGGIFSGMILMTVFGLPAWLLLSFFGVKSIITSRKYQDILMAGRYKIIKATCTRKEEKYDEENGRMYSCYFSNGAVWQSRMIPAIVGDPAYFVYLPGKKKFSTCFNAIDYMPADDLVIEEQV